jgi:hypothetical protein
MQNETGGPKVQWTHPGFLTGVCMLNSDIAMYKEIPVDKAGFVSTPCGRRISACGNAPTWADFNRCGLAAHCWPRARAILHVDVC